MANITVLDQNTINKIAAGEVIERPASVVKELLENAIDAQATAVTIEIKEGGTTLIRVTDNGCGIPKDQISLAFLRHATSKIKSVEDLFTVSSLGFRGEALASIAAVAQVELITKTGDSLTGFRYQIEGGTERGLEEVGAPDGTTFIARNLFYNTPARKKFLKRPVTEGAYVADLVEKIALSHPEISIRFIQNKMCIRDSVSTVIQGFIMTFATLLLIFGVVSYIRNDSGSMAAAWQKLAASDHKMIMSPKQWSIPVMFSYIWLVGITLSLIHIWRHRLCAG